MTTIPTDGRTITYQTQYRKCGKPRCRTCKNGPGHGPYVYAFWTGDDKKLHSGYVGKAPKTMEGQG